MVEENEMKSCYSSEEKYTTVNLFKKDNKILEGQLNVIYDFLQIAALNQKLEFVFTAKSK